MVESTSLLERFRRRFFARKKYRDHLFQSVFREKKDLLELYNALNNTHYNNPEELTITTLEDALYMSMKNDLSFILSSTLNLYEHQSTVNENMPVRGLLYFAKQYDAYIRVNKLDIYNEKRIELPMPQFIVFYNGRKNQPDERELRLSDSFMTADGFEPALECRARVLNINYGHNKKLMEASKKLHDYSYFVNEVYSNQDAGMDLEDAIDKAIEDCIENDILAEYLERHRSEVFDMLLFTYDEKLHKKTIMAEAREEGRAEGREENRREAIEAVVRNLKVDKEKAMDILDIPEDEKEKYRTSKNL